MNDSITLTGLVATAPRHVTTSDGLSITSFRLASSQSHFDRKTNSWVDGETNWYTINAFRRLAVGAASLTKGDRVLVTGRVKIRAWKSGEREGTSVEVDADAIGPDLTWGTAIFTRTVAASGDRGGDTASAPEAAAAEEAWPSAGVASGVAEEAQPF